MRHYTCAIVYILTTLVLAHLFADGAYRWQVNSISQLAAQGYEKAWIMRAGFIGFGVLIQVTGVRRIGMARKYWLREILIMLYGLTILLSGFFSAEPFLPGTPYSQQEAQYHGAFATAAGIALTAAILVYAVTDTPNQRKIGHAVGLGLVMLFSLLFGLLPGVAGVMQRLLWVAGFSWLLYLGINLSAGAVRPGTKPAA